MKTYRYHHRYHPLYPLNILMKGLVSWVKDLIEGFHNIIGIVLYTFGIKETKETESIKTEID